MTTAETTHYSIVIPCFNEEASLANTVVDVLKVGRDAGWDFELILINDGSRDATATQAYSLASTNPEIRVIDLTRNFGQAQAYQAGFDAARGTVTILFSADNETPAENIATAAKAVDDGWDFVNTCRVNRWKGARAIQSKVANAITNRISGLVIHDRGSGLKAMTTDIARRLRLYGEWHRFLPDLASIYTSRILEIPVEFRDRTAGVSAYAKRLRTLAVFLDLAGVAFCLRSRKKPFSMLPARLFGFTGMVLALVGGGVAAYFVALKLAVGAVLSDRPLFMLAIMLLVLGAIMAMVGLLGEMAFRFAAESSGIRDYVLRPSSRAAHPRTPLAPKAPSP